MTEHGGRYYLQYGAPGTEFSGYADGVYVGDGRSGRSHAPYNPFSYKPGGFARGAGQGCTFQDKSGDWWNSPPSIVVKELRASLGAASAGFDADGQLYTDTASATSHTGFR